MSEKVAEAEVVQVSDVRKTLRSRLAQQKPLILRRNRSTVGILLCVEPGFFWRMEHPRLQARRLRAELEVILKQITR
jgi:hypothetical protein